MICPVCSMDVPDLAAHRAIYAARWDDYHYVNGIIDRIDRKLRPGRSLREDPDYRVLRDLQDHMREGWA